MLLVSFWIIPFQVLCTRNLILSFSPCDTHTPFCLTWWSYVSWHINYTLSDCLYLTGTDEERGTSKWHIQQGRSGDPDEKCPFDLPTPLNNFLLKFKFMSWIPISPSYTEENIRDKVRTVLGRKTKSPGDEGEPHQMPHSNNPNVISMETVSSACI